MAFEQIAPSLGVFPNHSQPVRQYLTHLIQSSNEEWLLTGMSKSLYLAPLQQWL